MTTLQQRIERTATKLATLKAQAQAREAREKTRDQKRARQMRTRALVLWGIAMEREAKAEATAHGVIRDLITTHLHRPEECAAAMQLLDELEAKTGANEP